MPRFQMAGASEGLMKSGTVHALPRPSLWTTKDDAMWKSISTLPDVGTGKEERVAAVENELTGELTESLTDGSHSTPFFGIIWHYTQD